MAKSWLPPHTVAITGFLLLSILLTRTERFRGVRGYMPLPSTSHHGQCLGKGGKPVCVGPWVLSTAAASQTSVFPAAAWGRMGGTHLSWGGHRGHWPATDSSADRLQVCRDLSLSQKSRVSHQHRPMLLCHQHHCAYQCPSSLTSTVTPRRVTLLPPPCLPQHYSIPTHLSNTTFTSIPLSPTSTSIPPSTPSIVLLSPRPHPLPPPLSPSTRPPPAFSLPPTLGCRFSVTELYRCLQAPRCLVSPQLCPYFRCVHRE